MSLFQWAMHKRDWDVAALCLLLGTFEAASKLPRTTVARLANSLRAVGRPGEGKRIDPKA